VCEAAIEHVKTGRFAVAPTQRGRVLQEAFLMASRTEHMEPQRASAVKPMRNIRENAKENAKENAMSVLTWVALPSCMIGATTCWQKTAYRRCRAEVARRRTDKAGQ
jgi:hypothetical protein